MKLPITQAPVDPIIADVAAAENHFKQSTITYPDWLNRVNTGYYSRRGINPTTQTHWGQGLALLDKVQVSLKNL